MKTRTWTLHRDPANKYGGMMTFGTRPEQLPPNAIISATRSERFSIGRLILNNILNQFIMRQLAKMEGLVYAELNADMKEGYAQTMLVWTGKELSTFNKRGAHSFARRFFGWVLLGGKVHLYSLNWAATGSTPTAAEVEAVLKNHGKLHVAGELVRKPSRPAETGVA